ncbi:hypothetical protein RJ640_007289 [Escallonia rubra]|uniref:Pollen Ole e 1 allergen and extensin family protein n=1 Tax=Escallonia rubra TaxID=112253 RepID=A0AA88R891_9ASTE|nr:hypothetical protein RJ640_007289 [Escallonia rubra]
MALPKVIIALFFALALARVELSACYVLTGNVKCLDCSQHYDLAGIKVLVKCSEVKKLAMATTDKHGLFKTDLPMDTPTRGSSNCETTILGGPKQLYVLKKNTVSKIFRLHETASYTVVEPLKVYTSCPLSQKDGSCVAKKTKIGSSKTVDLPIPREWGLAPTSYYIPFVPIIGIP